MIAKNRQGVTLIELLVVIVIISILAALVLPSFKNVLSERKTNAAALEVKSFLEAARARAIARGRSVSVILERLSSRTDGFAIDETSQVSSTNPLRSITAMNSVSNLSDNYSQYNTSIRMLMAEESSSLSFDAKARVIAEPLPGFPAQIGDDADGLVEPSRILRIANTDPRLANLLQINNQIELRQSSGTALKFIITNFGLDSGDFVVTIDNEGSSQSPFGSYPPLSPPTPRPIYDIEKASCPIFTQRAWQHFVQLSGEYEFAVSSVPVPTSSLVQELPKGTCIDLSVSGLAFDDPLVNNLLPLRTFRDCQRQFASDWIFPPPAIASPSQLRPIYITFSPNGSVESVLSNRPNQSSLRNIQPNTDIFLFIGRTDQVVLPLDLNTGELNAAGIAQREDEGAKPNLLDPTGYWVRISAVNGSIAAAPAQAFHVTADVEEARTNPTGADTLGEMLTESRALTFQGELSSQ